MQNGFIEYSSPDQHPLYQVGSNSRMDPLCILRLDRVNSCFLVNSKIQGKYQYPRLNHRQKRTSCFTSAEKANRNVTRSVLFLFLQIIPDISTTSAVELSSSVTTPLSSMKIPITLLCYSIFSHEVEPTEKWQITINGQWPLWFK